MTRRKAKESEIDFRNKDRLVELLERGRNRQDIGKEVIEDLGFVIGMWNGDKSRKMVGLSITCGLFATTSGLGGNCVLLDLPEDLGGLVQCERVENVLTALVKCWEPEWAGVLSLEAMNAREFNAAIPFVDWMVYVSGMKCENPSLRGIFAVDKVNDQGSIIVVQPNPPQPDNAAHIERVKAVEAVIGSC